MSEKKQNKHQQKKNLLSDHSDCYICPPFCSSSNFEDLPEPETQNFFVDSQPLSASSLTTNIGDSGGSPMSVHECGIYSQNFDNIRPTTSDGKDLLTLTPLYSVDKPSPLYCSVNEFNNLMSTFDSLTHHLDMAITELTCKQPSGRRLSNGKQLQELNSFLLRLCKIKNQTSLLNKKFDKTVSRLVYTTSP